VDDRTGLVSRLSKNSSRFARRRFSKIGLSVTPLQEVSVAVDSGAVHRDSIPLTMVITYRLTRASAVGES
jgi:hypothetical protein